MTWSVVISSLVAKLFRLLRPHGQSSMPDSSVHGIYQAKILEWAAISFSGDMVMFLSKEISGIMSQTLPDPGHFLTYVGAS